MKDEDHVSTNLPEFVHNATRLRSVVYRIRPMAPSGWRVQTLFVQDCPDLASVGEGNQPWSRRLTMSETRLSLLCVLLLAATWVAAQSAPSTGTSPGSSGTAGQSQTPGTATPPAGTATPPAGTTTPGTPSPTTPTTVPGSTSTTHPTPGSATKPSTMNPNPTNPGR